LSKEVQYYKESLDNSNNNPQVRDAQPVDNTNGPLANPDVDQPTEGDFIWGNPEATFVLVEYSDFDCPFCENFHNTAEEFIKNNEGDIMWVYRQFPLYGLHPNAEAKAIASECAAAQGGNEAFWSYADQLFATQDEEFGRDAELESYLVDIASSLNLNISQFTSCYENKDTLDEIRADISSAEKAGVSGTPGNFLLNLETGDVVPLQGAVPINVLENAYQAFK
jgi:protein-disulfide isomerase